MLDAIGKFLVDPLGSLIDVGAGLLGIPDSVKNAAKIAIGAITLNPITVANGVAGLACAAKASKPVTEYVPPRKDAPVSGYCQTSSQGPTAPDPYKSKIVSLDLLQREVFDWLLSQPELAGIAGDVRRCVGLNPAGAAFYANLIKQHLQQDAALIARLESRFNVKFESFGAGSEIKVRMKKPASQPTATKAPTGMPPAPTRPSSAPSPSPPDCGVVPGRSMRDIVCNPSLSIEEKIQAILARVCENTDAQILELGEEIGRLSEAKQSLTGTDEESKKASAKLTLSMDQLTLRLQSLVERRKQMFSLMSTLSMNFHEMAKTAIANLARA